MPEPQNDAPEALHTPNEPEAQSSGGAVPPPSSTASSPPAAGSDMITRLRAEAEACEDPVRKAVLLHEAAELEERVAGDELGAAREYLAAFNLDNGFREPLEALVRILERRRSLKNLARVLDSMSKSADTSEERARALRALAADAVDVKNDRDGAREFLEQAVDADASDQTAWLMLEIDAGMRRDGDARRRALARRVELTSDPKWAGLLRVDLADEKAEGGDVDDALDVLTEVISSQDAAAFRACEAAERLARKAERQDREAWALVQRGDIVLESLQEPPSPRGLGVPRALRRAGVAADAYVRAAAAYRGCGRVDDELVTLERAIEVDGDATMPHLARIAAATRLGDLDRASQIARALLARDLRPDLAPNFWLAIAEGALAHGDRDGVIEACDRLLEAAKEHEGRSAVVPKTLLIDLLLDGADPQRLCTLCENDASTRPTEEGRARGYLVAATVRALFANDGEGARRDLDLALTNGAQAVQVARLAASLSATTPGAHGEPGDAAWYEMAADEIRAASDDEKEKSDLAIDLARVRAARNDRDGARRALETIADDAPHGLLARVARLALGGDEAGDALLAKLGEGTEGDAAIGFAVARAVRATRKDDAAARTEALAAIGAASEADELSSLVRASAALAKNPSDAASIMRELSRTSEDPTARDVLRLAAAILLVKGGARDVGLEVVDELETDATGAFGPARAIWQRRVANGDDDARRAAMDLTARDVLAEGSFGALERAIDRLVTPTGEGASAEELLQELGGSRDPSLARTAVLLQAIWPDENVAAETKEQAIGAIEALGGDAGRQLARASLRRAVQSGDPQTAIVGAEGWHRAGGGAPAALEMLIAAEQAADADAEVRARVALASSLTGPASQLVAASAALAAHVANLPPPPLPSSGEGDAAQPIALAQFELAEPGCDPTRREMALRGLADIVEGSSSTLHEMAAWSALARADYGSARALFARALELARLAAEEPRSALEGAIETELLAASGRPTPAWGDLVERLALLVETRGDVAGAATLFEQVGHAWWDRIGDQVRGERALGEAFARDNTRKAAFERVFRAARTRKEDDRLLEIVAHRLEATDDPPEMAKLFWEQARVLRGKGDRDAALSALENVTMLEPDHVGALALSAEIYVGRQQYEEAATALDRLSRQPVPAQQKLGAGLGAADLYEAKLDRSDKALDVLVALDKAGLGDVAVHERIARAAAKAEAWIPATAYLAKLVTERPDPQGRAEAARLCAAIYRDRLDDPQAAVPALVALLRESPADLEAAEQLLDANPGVNQTRDALHGIRNAARAQLLQSPADVRTARLVSRTAALLGDPDLQQVGLSVLTALHSAEDDERRTAAAYLARLGTAPAVALDKESARRLAAPEEAGPISDLFRLLAPTIAEALGPTQDTLAVGRRERVDARSGNALRNEIGAWAGALGIAEFDFFIGGKDPNAIQGVPGELPALVIGANVRAPLSLPDRARLVRELVALERGTTVVLQRDDVAVAAIVVAACTIAEVPLQMPAYSVLAETQRLMNKAISRKTKKVLPDIAQAVAKQLGGGGDLRTFRGHALRTLDRAAAIATGDAGAALAQIVGADAPAAKIAADPRAAAMLRFVWSDDYFALRKQLGLGIG